MDEPACPGCRELHRQVDVLASQVAELTRKFGGGYARRQALSAVDRVSQAVRGFGNRLLPRPLLFEG